MEFLQVSLFIYCYIWRLSGWLHACGLSWRRCGKSEVAVCP